MIHEYLKWAGIRDSNYDLLLIEKIVSEIKSQTVHHNKSKRVYYSYLVPKLSEDGTCSLIEELDSNPYDLSNVLGGRTAANDRFLGELDTLLVSINNQVKAGWIGIYKRFDSTSDSKLVKLVYQGIPSRAEFPLTKEFAANSNNSTVGMTGKAVIIQDVSSYLKKGGPYYKCDGKVNSEACLPVFNKNFSKVIGIIDAESHESNFFNKEKIARLIALCIILENLLV